MGRSRCSRSSPPPCDALLVSGNGAVTANGNIQVNSTCTTGAMRRQGGGDISVTATGAACNVAGDITDGGGRGAITCAQNEGAPVIPDPLLGLPEPPKPGYPADIVRLTGTRAIPAGCPGAVAPALESTELAPLTCQFPSAYAGTTWRIYPGYYPGGLHLQGGTFYFEPGIYWIGGGGIQVNGNGTVSISVASGGHDARQRDPVLQHREPRIRRRVRGRNGDRARRSCASARSSSTAHRHPWTSTRSTTGRSTTG